MKKTLIALMALSGTAMAAWNPGGTGKELYEVTENVDTVTTMGEDQNITGDYQLKAKNLGTTPANQNFEATIGEYILRGGKKVVIMDRWQNDSTNLHVTINKLTVQSIDVTTGEGESATTTTYNKGKVGVNAGQKLTLGSVAGIIENLELAAGSTFCYTGSADANIQKITTSGSGNTTINFGTSYVLKSETGTNETLTFSMGSGSGITLDVNLSDSELATLDNRGDVSRTLITSDRMKGLTTAALSNQFSLTLNGAELDYVGVVYRVTKQGVVTYHNISDVTINDDYGAVSADTAIDLAYGSSYIVVDAQDYSGASIKGISFMATAIPEPATATLSLLALAGLAARRRRH